MPLRIVFAIVALNCIRLLAGESDPDLDDPLSIKPSQATLSQDKGLAPGSFNPWKRGINLPPNAKFMVIPVNDETSKSDSIDPWQALFIQRRLRAAEREKYDIVVLEIDSLGGDREACESVTTSIENCKVPVVAFVHAKAKDIGALLALGCKAIVMEPNSEIGSTPAMQTDAKSSAAILTLVRNLCTQNGYPHALAQGLVDSSIEVVETNDSNQRFMTGDEYQLASKRGTALVKKWKLKDRMFALNAKDAVNAGLASGVAADLNELAVGLNVPKAAITRYDISTSEKIARFLSWQLWLWMLVIVGLFGLFWEMAHPSHGVGYATFVFCMGVFFWLQIFSNRAGLFEILLFGLGAMLVAVELFVLPTFGALGFAGIAMVIGSIVLAFLPEGSVPGLLGFSGRPNAFLMRQIIQGMEWATLTLLSVLGFFGLIWWKGISLPGFNRIALTTVNGGTARGSAELPKVVPAGKNLNTMAGLAGTVETVLRPAGKVRIDGATYDAVSEGGFIEPGNVVYVLRAQGSALVVRLSDMKK